MKQTWMSQHSVGDLQAWRLTQAVSAQDGDGRDGSRQSAMKRRYGWNGQRSRDNDRRGDEDRGPVARSRRRSSRYNSRVTGAVAMMTIAGRAADLGSR